jgi:hypothetical protein
MTLLFLFLCRRLLQGCLSWFVALFVLGWVLRHDPLLWENIKDLIREVLNGF